MNMNVNTLSLNKSTNGNLHVAMPQQPTQLESFATIATQALKPQESTMGVKAAAVLKRKKFDQKEIELLRTKLLDAPTPARVLEKTEVLEELSETLKELTKRGHSRDQIRALLAEQGLTFSAREVKEAVAKIGLQKLKTVAIKSSH